MKEEWMISRDMTVKRLKGLKDRNEFATEMGLICMAWIKVNLEVNAI